MPNNKQSNFIASVKAPNTGFIKKIYYYSVNYHSLLSNIFPLVLLVLPPIIFFYKI